MSAVKYPEITVQLTGEDGNAFAIIGNVMKAIRKGVGSDEAKEFADEAMSQGSYDELLAYCMRMVNVL